MRLQARLPVTFLSVALAIFANARTELNSFLNRPASTSSQLVRQLNTDPVVADRYIRHFAMSKKEIAKIFSTLSVRAIPKAAVFEVYNVPRDGTLRVRHLKFARGTKIWVDAIGNPVLKVSCGNPLTKGPNSPVAISENESAPKSLPVSEYRTIVVENVPVTIEEQLPVAMAVEPSTPEVIQSEQPLVEPPTVGPTTIGEAPALIAPPPSSNVFSIVPTAILSILPIIGGNNIVSPPPIPPVPPVVPEPTTWLAMSTGIVFALTRKFKRKH